MQDPCPDPVPDGHQNMELLSKQFHQNLCDKLCMCYGVNPPKHLFCIGVSKGQVTIALGNGKPMPERMVQRLFNVNAYRQIFNLDVGMYFCLGFASVSILLIFPRLPVKTRLQTTRMVLMMPLIVKTLESGTEARTNGVTPLLIGGTGTIRDVKDTEPSIKLMMAMRFLGYRSQRALRSGTPTPSGRHMCKDSRTVSRTSASLLRKHGSRQSSRRNKQHTHTQRMKKGHQIGGRSHGALRKTRRSDTRSQTTCTSQAS